MQTYHDVIIDLIYYILGRGINYLDYVDTRNAYDKIIRNYHQVNSEGLSVYRNKRSKEFYRCSVNAYIEEERTKLYFEHLVPVKIIKSELHELIKNDKVTKNNIRRVLDKSEIVVITKEEARIIDRKHKTTLPESKKTRLEEYNIDIADETAENSIFIK